MTNIEIRLASLIDNLSYWRKQLWLNDKAATKEALFELRRCTELLKKVNKDLDRELEDKQK